MEDVLRGKIKNVADIVVQERESMFNLLCSYFEDYEPANFITDLEDKEAAILFYDSNQVLKGFTTIGFFQEAVNGRAVRAIYSGDTIMDRDYWSRNDLFQVWIPYALEKKEETPELPLYWLLLSSGYRTYKYLPTFVHEYHPRHDKRNDELKSIADVLARAKYGNDYDPEKGIVVFSHSQERLNEETAEIPDSQKGNPHVQYFLERNPFYYMGHELVCLAEVSRSNFKEPILRRLGI